MEKWKSVSKKTSAFTIVELLTVMGVIAILISLLVPALNLVRDYARELQQKAQFHSIEVAMDMFVTESGYGTYPPSTDNSDNTFLLAVETISYGGAQKLAEALVGWDLMGYHPDSLFMSDGGDESASVPPTVYDTTTNLRQNLEERKGPFIDLENANAFMMGEIYPTVTAPLDTTYVLCDVYAKKRHAGKKTGMPILYYRAKTENIEQTHDQVLPPSTATVGIEDDIYYYRDNMYLLALGTPDGKAHILDGSDSPGIGGDHERFENVILNNQITTMRRPYRANSYILISAGKDGIYGTGDDLTNFTKE